MPFLGAMQKSGDPYWPAKGASQERSKSHCVPGTGEEMVRRPANFSPVPGTFTPKIGTHPPAKMLLFWSMGLMYNFFAD